MGAGEQGLDLYSSAFLFCQGAGSEMQQPLLDLAPIWDANAASKTGYAKAGHSNKYFERRY